MRIQVGAGGVRLPGFLNVDIRATPAVDIVGHAGNLAGVADDSVDVVFSHALFEHLFVGHQLAALREWKRVLRPSGQILCIGLPDFSVIARLYVDRAPGIVGPHFDLFNVYRYTHGEPEHAVGPTVWRDWCPNGGRRSAPPGYVPQLHKSLLDPPYIRRLAEEVGLFSLQFNYRYPGETHALVMGFVAAANSLAPNLETIYRSLAQIPQSDRFVSSGSITLCESGADIGAAPDEMFAFAKRLESTTAPRRGMVRRAAAKVRRMMRG